MRRLSCLLILTAACNLPAQTTSPRSLGGLVLAELAALSAAPNLATWRKSHPNERLQHAAYDDEYETQGMWCAASVADFALPGDIKATRQAFFYIPPGKADPLPGNEDPGLVQRCRLLALWYEVKAPERPAGLVQSVSAELGVSLGPANEPPAFRRDGDWGSGYWKFYTVWGNENRRVALAVDPGGPGPAFDGLAKRLLVIARSPAAPRGMSSDWLERDAPKGQPSRDDTAESAGVTRMENPCSFDDGRNNWEGGLIRFGEKLLQDYPASQWRPYIHLTLARAYAARLRLTYPGVYLDGADRPATEPDMLRRGAIDHFRAFLAEDPGSREANSAWREAWRLLAGLPPSPMHFACTD